MPDANSIAAANDRFRTTLVGGRVMITREINVLGPTAIAQIIAKVREFSEFGPDNDPHDEHDFGCIEHDRVRVFWKIDYYDRSMTAGADNPADAAATLRIMTVMLADEY